MRRTDRRTDEQKQRLLPPSIWTGHNNAEVESIATDAFATVSQDVSQYALCIDMRKTSDANSIFCLFLLNVVAKFNGMCICPTSYGMRQ